MALSHSKISTTQIYTHIVDEEMEEAMKGLGGQLAHSGASVDFLIVPLIKKYPQCLNIGSPCHQLVKSGQSSGKSAFNLQLK